ncbi:MAG: DUF4105 domain-containing protein [Chitinophagales bacterium]|nr:DUF4105 domain-containing protein [Chitinophagales bacterium]
MLKSLAKQLVLFALIIIGNTIHAQNEKYLDVPKLSSDATVSLLTVGSGTEIYQLFGHTGIRITDPKFGWDLVYNYGTFNFGEPNFVQKFIQGKLLYYLSIDTYAEFETMYKEENRSITEQNIVLDSVQKQRLFEALTINARDENKYYRYDFLADNCSTRPRDVLLAVIGGQNKSKFKFGKDADDNSSYRQLIDRHNFNEWLDFGMDLLIGLPTDKKAGFGRTFLPEELMQLFDNTTYDGKKIVSSNSLILDKIPEHIRKPFISPALVFWLLFLILFIMQIKRKTVKRWKVFPAIYLSILGILGWFLLFMWFGTDHTSTKWNLNLLWAMPLNFPLAFFMLREKSPNWILIYFKIYRIILAVLIILWWLNPQEYHKAVFPIILIAIILVSRFLPIPTSADLSSMNRVKGN